MIIQKTSHLSPVTQSVIFFACTVIIIAGLKLSAGLVAPLLFAFTLTLLVWPILQWLQKKGLPKWLAMLLVTVTGVISLLILIVIFVQSLEQLNMKLPFYMERLNTQLSPIGYSLNSFGADSTFLSQEGYDAAAIVRTVINVLVSFIGNIFNVAIFLFSLVLMIVSSDSFVRKFKNHFKEDETFLGEFSSWSKSIQDQYRVQTVSNLLSGIITTILFLVLRIDFAILWGMLTFVLAYIPNIGIILASVAPVIIAFILFGWEIALLTVALIVLLNFFMDNIVTPRFMGEQLKVPLIVVFLSFTFWTWVFGPLGAFISLPLTLAVRTLLAQNKHSQFSASLLASEEDLSKDDKKVDK